MDIFKCELKVDSDKLKTTVVDLEKSSTGLSQLVSELEKKNTSYKTQLSQLQAKINDLKKQLDAEKERVLHSMANNWNFSFHYLIYMHFLSLQQMYCGALNYFV